MKTNIIQLRNIIPILIGSAIYAFGLHYFILPNQLMEGGVTGIVVLLHYAFHWKLSISTILINIPLFVIGWRALGRWQMLYTIIGTISLAIFLAVIDQLIRYGWITPFQSRQDYMLVALYAGVTLGTGLGIVF